MLIDTHCHLDAAEFDFDRDAVHAAALAAGVERIVVPAVAVDSFQKVKTSVERYAGCVAAYGIHPLYVNPTWPSCATGWSASSRWPSAKSASTST